MRKDRCGNKKRAVPIILPKSFEDVQMMIFKLRSGHSAILDLSKVPPAIAQRMVDFLSGAAFALNSTVSKVGCFAYIAVPKGVKVTENKH